MSKILVEPRPLARRADGFDVRHELQLCRDDTFALTMLAASAVFLVEAEVVLGQFLSRFTCRRCIQLADFIEKANICRRIGAGAAADRRLVDVDDTGQMLDARSAHHARPERYAHRGIANTAACT